MNYEQKKALIANRYIPYLVDDEGMEWYPLTEFFRRILFRTPPTRQYRDSNLIRYMRVIDYVRDGYNHSVKYWCMNRKGIKFVLKRVKMFSGDDRTVMLKQKCLYEACEYFGVKRDIEEPPFVNIAPDLKDYDAWSVICMNYDPAIQPGCAWKLCNKCRYYYPASKNYFCKVGHYKDRELGSVCKQCEGGNFVCQNSVIQWIYKNGGLPLLMQLMKPQEEQDYMLVYEELMGFIDSRGVMTDEGYDKFFMKTKELDD